MEGVCANAPRASTVTIAAVINFDIEVPPNEMRLSCAAERDHSQMEDYRRKTGGVSSSRLLGARADRTLNADGKCKPSNRHRPS